MRTGTAATVPPPPPDLTPQLQERWKGLASDVRAASGGAEVDYLLLADLLRAQQRLDEVRAVLATDGLIVIGSKGNTRPHPLLVTESALRREVAQGYERLLIAPKFRSGYVTVNKAGRITSE